MSDILESLNRFILGLFVGIAFTLASLSTAIDFFAATFLVIGAYIVYNLIT